MSDSGDNARTVLKAQIPDSSILYLLATKETKRAEADGNKMSMISRLFPATNVLHTYR